MTGEEIINNLLYMKRYVKEDTIEDSTIDEAIKALEQQPCDDWYDVPSDEMTLEQARQAVKDLRKKLAEDLEKNPCGDAISRQAAIDTIESWLSCDDYNEAERHIMRAMQSVLYDLPSVKPQQPCEDCISRQEALEAFGLSEKTRKYGGDHSGYDTLMKYEIQDILEDLPSVTPKEKTGHRRLINSEWIDFLTEQFDISRTSAKEMLHVMMSVKKEDNFKKQFSGRK